MWQLQAEHNQSVLKLHADHWSVTDRTTQETQLLSMQWLCPNMTVLDVHCNSDLCLMQDKNPQRLFDIMVIANLASDSGWQVPPTKCMGINQGKVKHDVISQSFTCSRKSCAPARSPTTWLRYLTKMAMSPWTRIVNGQQLKYFVNRALWAWILRPSCI